MSQLPDVYRAVIKDQQRQLGRLIQTQGVGPLRKLYSTLMDAVTSKLRLGPGEFTEWQMRSVLAQLRLSMSGIIDEMAGKLGSTSYQVGIASAREWLQNLARLENTLGDAFMPLPILEISRLNGLVKDETSSLLRFHQRSLGRYGTHVVGEFEKQLSIALATGETGHQVIDRIAATGDLQWWQAERIVRTELAFASNASIRATNNEQADELDGDMWSRWSEHVSDDGAALDDRVGDDSLAMNGQVAPPGGQFTQPPTTPAGEEISASLVGKHWDHPPNRPNDRAVLTPWRAHWGVPGWIWRNGHRVNVTPAIAASISGPKPEPKSEPAPPAPAPKQTPPRPPPAPEPEPAPEVAKPFDLPFQDTPPPPAGPMLDRTDAKLLSKAFGNVADLERPRISANNQAEIRGYLHDTIGKYNLSNRDPRTGMGETLRIKKNLGVGIRGSHWSNGAIDIQTTVAKNAAKFARDHADGVDYAASLRNNGPDAATHTIRANDYRTLVHEQLHGYGPFNSRAYQGVGKMTEEAVTEIAARKIVRDQLGITHADINGKHAGELIGRARTVNDRGSYSRYIVNTTESVRQAIHGELGMDIGYDDAYDVVETAALRMKSMGEHPDGSTPDGLAGLFAKSMDYDDIGTRTKATLDKDKRDKLVEAIVKKMKGHMK